MKNVWKGLVVGALTGAGIGLVVDLLEALGQRGRRLSVQARGEASHLATVAETKLKEAELPDRARGAADKLADKVKDAELPDRARDAADKLADKVKDAELPDRARDAADKLADKVKDAELPDAARDLGDTVSSKVQQAVDTASDKVTQNR